MTTPVDTSVADNLITQVRDATDESNTEDVTDAEILRALNRAQKKFVRIATRRYKDFFKREQSFTVSDFSGRELTIPEAAFGLIINEFHAIIGGVAYEILPATTRQTALIETTAQADIGHYYAIRGDKLLVYPQPSGGTNATYRLRYQIRPPDLVTQQGRVTNIDDIASGEFYVDAVGSDLSTSVSDLSAFINVIDGTTGLIKTTLQVSALDSTTKKVTFKTSGLDRSAVFGRTVGSSLSSTEIALDDYICLAHGTCIPELVRDYDDYMIAYAALEVKRRMGEDVSSEYAQVRDLEQDIEKMWSGRPGRQRVARRNRYWRNPASLTGFYRY